LTQVAVVASDAELEMVHKAMWAYRNALSELGKH
jgi:hypothetical protein